MSFPFPFYSSLATITKDEENARKAKMSMIIEKYKDKVSSLPMVAEHNLCKYEGFWYKRGLWHQTSKADYSLEVIMALQDDFQALPTDVFLVSYPKSGATWLKALAFAIQNRTKYKTCNGSHPLLTLSPHDCVPFIESLSFLNNPSYANGLMATHIPYTCLPKSIISSDCRIVYLCRDPKDVLTSYWHFFNKVRNTPLKVDGAFELFSKGVVPYGSFWDHAIEYYMTSLERPDKVLFLTFEGLKKDSKNMVKKLADFIGNPFTEEEELDGSVQKIIELCCFENLHKVSKVGKQTSKGLSEDIFFRKGIVGDSVNYLTTEMIQILDKITKEKFDGLNISFEA